MNDVSRLTTQFSNAIKHLQRYSAISSHHIMFRIGEEIGHGISKKLTSTKREDLFNELSVLWKNLGLGEMEVQRQKPILLKIYGCVGCDQGKVRGKLRCELCEGVIQTILNDKLRLNTVLHLSESIGRGTGFNICTFNMRDSS